MIFMLKNKRIFVTIMMSLGLLLGSAATVYAMPEHGFFDDFEGNTIVGWGWNANTPNTAIPVHVTVTNKATNEKVGDFHPTAGTYRDDLKSNGVGNGNHGFRIEMNWNSLPDGQYLIEGWADGKAFGNTKTYSKGAAAAETTKAEEKKEEQTAAQQTGLRSLGSFRTTGYCPCYQCSEGWGRKTSTGATARAGHTIAVDPRVIPYGSKVMVNGVIYTAEDRGGGVKGKHIDIFFDTHSQTRQHGSRMQEVFLIQ